MSLSRKKSLFSHKKGVMGIETLIIFIAMILVAAVAAGVMLKTSGLLQQRALATGTEATERIVTGFEVASVTANNVNTTANTFHEIEALVRLQAGSFDMNLLSLSYIMKTAEFSFQADMMHTSASSFNNVSITTISNSSWTIIENIDIDPDDSDSDRVRVVHDINGTIDGLTFNLTSYGLFNASLGVDIQNSSNSVSIEDIVIQPFNVTDDYPYQFGFFTYKADNGSNAVNTTSGGTAYISNAPGDKDCRWDELIPNVKFCAKTKIGDGDHVLESGELIALRYRLTSDKTRTGDENLDIQFIPKRGTIIDIAIYVPEVLSRTVVTLWP